MIDDEAEYNTRRQIRAQADADVAAFIASLDQDEETGVPPPVKIKISDVSTQPVEFAPFDFGGEGSGTASAPSPPPPPTSPTGACCSGTWPSLSCSILSESACTIAGGHYLGDGTPCSGVDCNTGACCEISGGCSDTQDFLCGACDPFLGTSCWQGYGTTCADTRCYGMCCCPVAGGCTLDLTFDECCTDTCPPGDCAWLWYWSSNYGDCSSLGC